jgi:HAD superfamily hydrolase (TIGR01493 family)
LLGRPSMSNVCAAEAILTQQLEYTWLRTMGQQYVDFWEVTEEALVFSCRSLKLRLTKPGSDRLMQSYLELKAWPDAPAALKGLKASGMRMAFLSNFTAAMLDQAVKNSDLEGIFSAELRAYFSSIPVRAGMVITPSGPFKALSSGMQARYAQSRMGPRRSPACGFPVCAAQPLF